MLGRLTKKLDSQRGASFIFALVILVTCIALSIVVLASSVAASGRFVELSKREKNYYSVISAARLFRDEVINKEVTVTETIQSDGTASRTMVVDGGGFGTVIDKGPLYGVTQYLFVPGGYATQGTTLPAPYDRSVPPGGTPPMSTLSFEVEPDFGSDYVVDVDGKLDEYGFLTLDFHNAGGAIDAYHLTLVLEPAVSIEGESVSGDTATRNIKVTWQVLEYEPGERL